MPVPKPRRILAIDPGTKEMGVAVLQGDALIHHGVEVITKCQSPHETLEWGRGIVADLITNFRPDTLVIEKTFIGKNRRLALLNVFADEIRALGRHKKLIVLCITPTTVKKAITGDGWASKEDVARAVVARYPVLRPYLLLKHPSIPKWKGRFHCNMFHAVAIGLVGATARQPDQRHS